MIEDAHLSVQAVVLTNQGSRGALDVLRALAYENIHAVVVSSDPDEIAATSRFCTRLVRIHPYRPETDEQNLRILRFLALTSIERPVLFFSDDAEMMFISRNRTALSAWYRFLLPTPDLAESFVDKVKFHRLAQDHHLPVPVSRIAFSLEELDALSRNVSYPVFVKPAVPSSWSFHTPEDIRKYRSYKHALRQFSTAEEMLEYCRNLPIDQGGVLVQEFISGTDREVYSFHGFFDEHSRVIAYFVGRKIRTYPVHHGGSACVETVEEPEVARLCIDALSRLGCMGVVKVDLKRNPRDGTFQILEVNPRFTLWVSLGAYAGINLPVIVYHYLRGELREGVEQRYRTGDKWIFAKQDLRAFVTGYWRRGEWSLRQYVRSLGGRKVYQFFDWRDPAPFFQSGLRFWKKRLVRLFGS